MSFLKEDLLDLDIIQGLKELGGDDGDEFLKEILDLYSEQYPILLSQIKEYLGKSDYINLSKSAHALKGASLNIGAKEIASICKLIEINSKSGILDGYKELIANLESVHSLTFAEFSKI